MWLGGLDLTVSLGQVYPGRLATERKSFFRSSLFARLKPGTQREARPMPAPKIALGTVVVCGLWQSG